MNVERKWGLLSQHLKNREIELRSELTSASVSVQAGRYDVALASIPPRLALLEELQRRVEELNQGRESSQAKVSLPPEEKY